MTVEVFHLIETLGSGGAERLLHTNLVHLDRERFRSTVVTVRDEGEHWRTPIESLGIPVASLGVKRRVGLLGAARRLKKLLERRPPALLHTHLFEANAVGRIAGRLAGVPVVSSIHNPDYEPEVWRLGEQGLEGKRALFLAVDRATARLGCRRMIAVSDYVRQSAHRFLGFPLERIDLLYNPVDLEELRRPPARGRRELLEEIGLDENVSVLLSVARLSPQKGLHYAVDSLPRILEAHPRAHLVSVGAGDNRAWVETLERRCEARRVRGHVHFLGSRRDVNDWLRACDLFLFPSLFEGMGVALAEAMAAGRAAIATDVGPIPELVRNGMDGILVPPADPEALARAVVRALSDPAERARLGRAAEESAARRFDPIEAARRLASIYDGMLGAA